jgi:hypothetical protein
MFLLDTNVVSEFRRRKPSRAVVAWLADTPAERLFISAVTIGEIQSGIEIVREKDESRAAALETWLDSILDTHNVLALDADAFRTCARLRHRKPKALYEDAMIAAVARHRELTVVTRNVKDFEPFGVATLNPFDQHSRG